MNMPDIEIAIKVNKIFNRNKSLLKEYQDRYSRINFNLLVGLALGNICGFSSTSRLTYVIQIFAPIFKDSQLQEFIDLVTGINNYLVSILDLKPDDIYLLENNKWVLISEADFDSLYAVWYAFFGIMKVEFEDSQPEIFSLKNHPVQQEAIKSYDKISKVMKSELLSSDDISVIHNEFPHYAHKFNELRKLMYTKTIEPVKTTH